MSTAPPAGSAPQLTIAAGTPLPWFLAPSPPVDQGSGPLIAGSPPLYGPTLGIARQLDPLDAVSDMAPPASGTGGGNLNGSANTANLLGHAGTAAARIAVPRQNAGNFTGVI